MNGLHFFFGVGTLVTPIIVAQFISQEGGLLSTYLLLAAIIFPSAMVAFLPSPTSPVTAQARGEVTVDPLLIILISLVFGCYSGASMGFSGWIFTYVTRMGLADATSAAYLTSIFWAALTLGRLVAIPVSMRVKPQHILRADFAGALVSLLAMLLFPRSLAALIITSAGLGFTLASIYPTTMAFSGQNMVLSGRITGLFAIGSNAGAMIIPWAIGQFFETAGR
jgi:FHS family Na+ dependent glucose MFS transporter 1